MKVSVMNSIIDIPLQGHLIIVFQMFSFLKSKHNGVILFDPTEPKIELTQFLTKDWFTTPYSPRKEYFSSNAPVSRCIGFDMRHQLILITIVTRSLVSKELTLLCSSIVLLSLFILRNRVFLRHLFLVLIL